MPHTAFAALLALVLSMGPVPVQQPPVSVPDGTELQLRFRQLVTSHSSRPDTPVTARVIQPVVVDGRTVVPLGSWVYGRITGVRRVGLGFIRERAFVEIELDRLELADGQTFPVDLRITRIDDARETVDETGRIHGIRATASFASMISGMAVSTGFIDPMLLGFTTASSLSAFRIPESEVIFPPGTEFRARLESPLTLDTAFGPPVPEYAADAGQRQALTQAIRDLPYRTVTELGNIPSDVTNLLFLGSREAVAAAFDAAGWGQTDALDARSTYMALRAIVENQGYREAPMSTLLLDGRVPEFTYAKTLNTFFSRHHLRIFGDVGAFDGVPVWTSSSTHDSGIGFATQRKSFIHVIDEVIDEERDKVVHDLVLTGCVDAVTYVDRPWLPDELSNSTGDTLRTDKRIAVMRLNECASPNRSDLDLEAPLLGEDVSEKPNPVARGTRNTMLALKDSFWRGNIFYQGYSAIKLGLGALFRGGGEAADPEAGPRSFEFAGEQFLVVPGSEAHQHELAPEDVHQRPPTYDHVAEPPHYDPRLIFSIAGTETGFGADEFSTQGVTLPIVIDGVDVLDIPFDIVTSLRADRGFVGRVTLRTSPRLSQEFSYTMNRMLLVARVEGLLAEPTEVAARAQMRQFNYNLLVHARPNGRRIRPYAAFGPGVQLIRLNEAAQGTNKALKFAFKQVSLIQSTWEFGSKPPLEGGGIFQWNFQYGGGVKVHLTPGLVLRADYRETIAKQPDFWTKSHDSLRADGIIPTTLTRSGPMRHRLFSIGLGYGF